jgi:hypothetical protein
MPIATSRTSRISVVVVVVVVVGLKRPVASFKGERSELDPGRCLCAAHLWGYPQQLPAFLLMCRIATQAKGRFWVYINSSLVP